MSADSCRSLRFSKKYFWLGKEAVLPKDLHQYLRGEKPEHTHHNAAWSSQTGEGLLYFSKSAEQKATPAGIINLVCPPTPPFRECDSVDCLLTVSSDGDL